MGYTSQIWHLTRWFPKKNEAGVRSHLIFVMPVNAVTTACRLWQKSQAGTPHQLSDIETGEVIDLPLPANPNTTHLAGIIQVQTGTHAETEPASSTLPAHSLLGGQGILRWQRELAQNSRDKIIVFIGHQYGIFNVYELLVLVGVSFRHHPPHLDPLEVVLRRYGCSPKPRASPT